MSCARARDLLLEASPADIEAALAAETGVAGNNLTHLGACDSCAGLARQLLADHGALEQALAAARPVRLLDESVTAARRESLRRRARRSRAAWAVAAASLVALGGVRMFETRAASDRGGWVAPEGLVAALGPEVEALLDESVMVLETDDEDVVVFWFYQGRGE